MARDLMKLFEKGPPFGWQPKIGEAVYMLISSVTVIEGVIQGSGEKTHWSGQTERWYFILPDGDPIESGTITCSRNSIRPKRKRK